MTIMKKYISLESFRIIFLMLFMFHISLLSMPQTIAYNISGIELHKIISHPERQYVYLGNDTSNIIAVIDEISALDDNEHSPLHQFNDHVLNNCNIAQYDAI